MSAAPRKGAGSAGSPVVRCARAPNTIVALHTEGNGSTADVVTLDLCIRKPDTVTDATSAAANASSPGNPNGEDAGLIVKSMARDPKEAAAKTLDRIQLLFMPSRGKGSSAKKQTKESMLAACPPIAVLGSALDSDGNDVAAPLTELDTNLPNSEFWRRAKVVVLGEQRIAVKYNVPTITDIVPPSKPFVGLPLVCSNITTVFADAEDLHYEWCFKISDETTGEEGVTVLSREPAFEPGPELLGRRLLLRVTPDPLTGLWTQVELPPVQMPPPPVERWNETTTTITFPAFRVVTYNILYDDFCTSKSCKAKIYPFATDEVLDIENRQVRILQELLAYNADLICLQECGKKLFSKYLLPAMATRGFAGFYANKSGNVQEGCGFLFRRDRFSLEASEVIPLNWSTLEQREPALAAAVASHSELKEALANLTSIACILTLREANTGRELLLGNTHLFYHANACHIRVLQMYMLLSSLRQAAVVPGGGEEAVRPVVLCGDCNFTHSTGAYRLVTTGQVEDTHHSWEKGKLFWWGCDRQLGYSEDQLAELMDGAEPAQDTKNSAARKPDNSKKSAADANRGAGADDDVGGAKRLREPLTEYFHTRLHAGMKLTDAYGRTDPSLPWTNFTLTFREVIDYVFFSEDSIDVLRTVPIPPEAELAENYALPNAKYPSDHVSLIADLTFKR